jgi:hypothetical protein
MILCRPDARSVIFVLTLCPKKKWQHVGRFNVIFLMSVIKNDSASGRRGVIFFRHKVRELKKKQEKITQNMSFFHTIITDLLSKKSQTLWQPTLSRVATDVGASILFSSFEGLFSPFCLPKAYFFHLYKITDRIMGHMSYFNFEPLSAHARTRHPAESKFFRAQHQITKYSEFLNFWNLALFSGALN